MNTCLERILVFSPSQGLCTRRVRPSVCLSVCLYCDNFRKTYPIDLKFGTHVYYVNLTTEFEDEQNRSNRKKVMAIATMSIYRDILMGIYRKILVANSRVEK